MLGSTFGGNYLAMSAAIAVCDIIEKEHLVARAAEVGDYLRASLPDSPKIREVRGRGLMVGIEFTEPIAELRKRLEGRGTDAPEVIDQRIARAEFELTFADKFDKIVVNDDLAQAEADALSLVNEFLLAE
jgi:4-aminobutyrate aminotransferase-like enzyme